jgi:hypothetical protein
VEKNSKRTWVKSLSIVMAVLVTMTAAGYFMLTGEETAEQGGKVEAAMFVPEKEKQTEPSSEPALVPVDGQENVGADVKLPVEVKSVAVASNTTVAVDYNKAESKPVETATEAPAAQPAVSAAPAVMVEAPQLIAAPVSYKWGTSANYVFRMEVKVTNNGSETAKNVNVSVPLLENSSPYQTTKLKSANYGILSSSGRVSTFNLGDIASGETKVIVVDFDINIRTLSLNSSNETVEKARKIYEQHAGDGNCRDLALAFISKSREQGINAREVIGFARTQRGAMTSGSLQGSRHSWAEFYVDGLGWVPVDLTFQYFGTFPHTSHIVESYSDQSIKVTYTGGSLAASWSNAVM